MHEVYKQKYYRIIFEELSNPLPQIYYIKLEKVQHKGKTDEYFVL